jgi:hypothetical protein
MKDLKLNQRILADSTWYSRGQVVELCLTTLKDALNTPRGVEIILGEGHSWGCIPTRDRNRVIANIGDLRGFFDEKISRKEGLEQRLKEGKSVLRVYENKHNKTLYVVEFTKQGEVNSLRDGNYIEFSDNGFSGKIIKVYNGNFGAEFYTDIESAFKELERVAEILL